MWKKSFVALGLGLVGAAGAWASGGAGGWPSRLAEVIVGQNPAPGAGAAVDPAGSREACDELLKRASGALAEGNLELADSLVARAEQMKVRYGLLHTGATPARLRKEVDQARTARGAQLPSGRFSPQAADNARPLAAPPAGNVAERGNIDVAVDRLTDDKYVARSYVQQGQKALSERDFLKAEHFQRQAAGVRCKWDAGEYTPDRLLTDIRSSQANAQALGRGGRDEGVVRASYESPYPNDNRPRTTRTLGPDGVERVGVDFNTSAPSYPVQQGIYQPSRDNTQNRLVQDEELVPPPQSPAATPPSVTPPSAAPGNVAAPITTQPRPLTGNAGANAGPATPNVVTGGAGEQLFRRGLDALNAGNKEQALTFFKEAYNYRDQLEPLTLQRLQEHLTFLSVRPTGPGTAAGGAGAPTAEVLAARNLTAEVARRQFDARQMLDKEPKRALELLRQTSRVVSESTVDATSKQRLLAGLERQLVDTENYLKEHKFQLDFEEQNANVLQEVARRKETTLKIGDELKAKVDEYNRLMKEKRYAEAELIAKRAYEMDPNSAVTTLMVEKVEFVRNYVAENDIASNKRRGVTDVFQDIEESSVPFAGEYAFPKVERWQELTKDRKKYAQDGMGRMTESEREIQSKLKTKVSCRFTNQPLATVLQELAKAAGVSIHLDPKGLGQLGKDPSEPVTINLTDEISLKSALNLILDPLDMGFVIKDEVLKVTSRQLRSGEVYIKTYPVADLVIPIPNFVPTQRMGLAGALYDAHARLGNGSPGMYGAAPAMVVASADGAHGNATLDPALLAQINSRSGLPAQSSPIAVGGPGGAGGGVQPDFESITELVTQTVHPTTWDGVGGPGTIKDFANNLTLVISQTQDVHEEIVDLLEQLRRLQDLQVTIEVRFITLRDDFFERIGIDFDFDIDDNVGVHAFDLRRDRQTVDLDGDGIADIPADQGQRGNGDSGRSITVGLQGAAVNGDFNGDGNDDISGSALIPTPFYSTDLDLQFRQGSFGATAPVFGGFNPATAASFGFAILSDIEAFFFIQAAQGDVRTNVMQAPKVTLFNGQQAYVSDTRQVPFVTSVIPVVGDFAAAHQPVIVVLNEGSALTLQAVVSNDRRFVRLTVVPFFSRVGDVDTFTFNGRETTVVGTASETDADTDTTTSKSDTRTVTREGTTVQLPTFEFVTVSTTVSVPDGGTVLLGGVKRLREERRENGVPMLSKIPYISRLFKNVGIGRETESLMMMVTPRIIIQEEEEQKIGGSAAGP